MRPARLNFPYSIFRNFSKFGFLFSLVSPTPFLLFSAPGFSYSSPPSLENIEVTTDQQRQIMSQLFEMNRSIKSTVSEKSKIQEKKFAAELQAKHISRQIVDLEEQLKEQRKRLSAALSSMINHNQQGPIQTLFGSTSPQEMEIIMKILGRLALRNSERIQNHRNTLAKLAEKKRKLLDRTKELLHSQHELAQVESDYLRQIQSKQGMLNKLRSFNSPASSETQHISENSMSKKFFFEQMGQLPAPLNFAKLILDFGAFRDPKTQLFFNNKGIDLVSTQLSPVKSVFEGIVRFADSIPALGRTIIVDHGDHYYSVYGSLASLKVLRGASVQTQETIAQLDRQNPSLYFEIRHYSEPLNPTQWFKEGTL
jgi:murein hydrolase activator